MVNLHLEVLTLLMGNSDINLSRLASVFPKVQGRKRGTCMVSGWLKCPRSTHSLHLCQPWPWHKTCSRQHSCASYPRRIQGRCSSLRMVSEFGTCQQSSCIGLIRGSIQNHP